MYNAVIPGAVQEAPGSVLVDKLVILASPGGQPTHIYSSAPSNPYPATPPTGPDIESYS